MDKEQQAYQNAINESYATLVSAVALTATEPNGLGCPICPICVDIG
jgi:hypothetical protein